jgi:crotonobetainyl-CoA:carnitine CoA-transferase CaiB-like acyl-CoA transferase
MNPTAPGPLDGVRILDLTTMISGPIATMMLADQGADVIKVESLEGDLVRELGANRAGASATFLSANRSKRSLAIDLKSPAGLAALQKLIPSCDVFIQNFRPGAIERMGLGEAAVPIEGGVPLIKDGQYVGGLGVSGVQSSQDSIIAQAGAATL